MFNRLLCALFQCSAGPVFGFSMDRMQMIKKNAPPQWVRVGLWCLVFIISAPYQVLWKDVHVAANYVHLAGSLVAAAVSFHFFYEGSFWNKTAILLILSIAAISAEFSVGLVRWMFKLPQLSLDYTKRDMVLGSLLGGFSSNTAMFFSAVIWRRFRLQKRMPKGSWAFVMMPLCLLAPTVIYCAEVYKYGSKVSLLHIVTMAGALILNLLLICVQFNQAEKDEMEKELSVLKHETKLERQYYQSMETRREEMAMIRHDYNNLLTSVLGLLRMGKIREAEETIQSLLSKVEQTRECPYCGIPIVNAILSEKEAQCRRQGITLRTDLLFPEDAAVTSIDLCSIFSNLLDNAIRACTHLPPDSARQIYLSVAVQGDYLLIRCDNSAAKAPGPVPEGSGYGMKILKDIARRYAGDFQTEFANGTFTARLILLAVKSGEFAESL